ncbi:hypothetical protein GMRT_11886 [Giardia muris]|uniref:Uncharacterized protein n=1 Tax=Giardia muris TaxID=5742 RepID=A0A4Z1SRW9_GIAMU|nr:hypothetical protein GMRT_11886 [Giardia muris]|eukprot:TNJ28500.1 hypothetical protein GMRT_11886 [Giardia muris]
MPPDIDALLAEALGMEDHAARRLLGTGPIAIDDYLKDGSFEHESDSDVPEYLPKFTPMAETRSRRMSWNDQRSAARLIEDAASHGNSNPFLLGSAFGFADLGQNSEAEDLRDTITDPEPVLPTIPLEQPPTPTPVQEDQPSTKGKRITRKRVRTQKDVNDMADAQKDFLAREQTIRRRRKREQVPALQLSPIRDGQTIRTLASTREQRVHNAEERLRQSQSEPDVEPIPTKPVPAPIELNLDLEYDMDNTASVFEQRVVQADRQVERPIRTERPLHPEPHPPPEHDSDDAAVITVERQPPDIPVATVTINKPLLGIRDVFAPPTRDPFSAEKPSVPSVLELTSGTSVIDINARHDSRADIPVQVVQKEVPKSSPKRPVQASGFHRASTKASTAHSLLRTVDLDRTVITTTTSHDSNMLNIPQFLDAAHTASTSSLPTVPEAVLPSERNTELVSSEPSRKLASSTLIPVGSPPREASPQRPAVSYKHLYEIIDQDDDLHSSELHVSNGPVSELTDQSDTPADSEMSLLGDTTIFVAESIRTRDEKEPVLSQTQIVEATLREEAQLGSKRLRDFLERGTGRTVLDLYKEYGNPAPPYADCGIVLHTIELKDANLPRFANGRLIMPSLQRTRGEELLYRTVRGRQEICGIRLAFVKPKQTRRPIKTFFERHCERLKREISVVCRERVKVGEEFDPGQNGARVVDVQAYYPFDALNFRVQGSIDRATVLTRGKMTMSVWHIAAGKTSDKVESVGFFLTNMSSLAIRIAVFDYTKAECLYTIRHTETLHVPAHLEFEVRNQNATDALLLCCEF